MDEFDCAVIGAGVVGLAVARALALAGREVIVLEAEGAIGTGTSSRNSEVIHAGIYYPPGLAEGAAVRRGQAAALRVSAQQRGVPHRRCGKLIVATTTAQVPELDAIAAKAAANGVHDLVLLDARRRRGRWSRQLACVAALHSPTHRHRRQPCADAEPAGRR